MGGRARAPRDGAHLLALEGVIVATIILGGILFLLSSGDPPGLAVSTRDEMGRLTDDTVRVLAGLEVEDERYGDRYLDLAVAAALDDDPSYLEGKLRRVLPNSAQFNVYLDNGYRAQLVTGSRSATGERVSSATAFAPQWAPAFLATDFGLYASGAGTPMRVTAWPVHHGRLLGGASLVANGDMEADADADAVPDGWTPDAAATAAREADGSFVWRIDLPAAGRGAYALGALAADEGTGFEVSARIKGARACVQFRYLDADLAPVAVGGQTAECIAGLAAASPAAYESVAAQVFLGESDELAHVQIELALQEAGTSRFDDVVVRPLARATVAGGAELPLASTGGDAYEGSWSAGGYATGAEETLEVEARWRGRPIGGSTTYATSAEPLLPDAWAAAVSGLDASTFTASESSVRIGESVALDYDFTAYVAALAADGVVATDPEVRLRVYAPVVAPDGALLLLHEEIDDDALFGTFVYAHPEDGLYGPLLVEASLVSGWTKAGYTDVDGQAARKALLLEARLRDGSPATPPLYRVVVETWFPEW